MSDKLDLSLSREQIGVLADLAGAFCRAWSTALAAAGERSEKVYSRLGLDAAGLQVASLGQLHSEIEDAARGMAGLAAVQGDDVGPWLDVAKRALAVQQSAAGVVEILRAALGV